MSPRERCWADRLAKRLNRLNNDNNRVAKARVDFDLNRIRFDPIDRCRTYPGQHSSSYGKATTKAQSPIFGPLGLEAFKKHTVSRLDTFSASWPMVLSSGPRTKRSFFHLLESPWTDTHISEGENAGSVFEDSFSKLVNTGDDCCVYVFHLDGVFVDTEMN